ncbi:MAG: bifunctional sugar-1-phosphate nucleotidylyltransferase/acetyltransferase [Promethearchaeota archaeon]|jgi:bifunctional UDP-N-acetylglucosamine pyrophosphorylase/glucosamine-1-phosphate N-acetyltransferase
MKAVIITAGEGKRLRPITSSRPKPLIPIAGKPLLEHTILGLKNSGIDEILLVVGYKENLIREYFGDGKEKFNLKIQYITQKEQLGTAHAFNYGKDFAANEAVLFMYGDLLVEPLVYREIIQKFNENKVEGIILLMEVKNPEEFGIISLNSNNFVDKIIEKPTPEMKAGNLANAGVFIFDPKIFQAINKTEKSIRGEYEFTDSMAILIDQLNGKIAGYVIKDYFWSDIGLPWEFLDGNNFLLDKIEREILGEVGVNVHIEGNVYIGEGTNIQAGSHIMGPCYIGNNNIIGPNSVIRPYTFIADDCIISMSEIKNSIILSNTVIPHFNYIGDSIICENVKLGAGTKVTNFRFDGNSVKVNIKGQPINSRKIKLGAFIGPNVNTGIKVSIMAGKIVYENSIIGAHAIVNDDIPPNTSYFPDPNKKIMEKKV